MGRSGLKIEDLKYDLGDIAREYMAARRNHNRFSSTHEAYAVLKEEVDELWEVIKGGFPIDIIKGEAKQVAAMALGILCEFDD